MWVQLNLRWKLRGFSNYPDWRMNIYMRRDKLKFITKEKTNSFLQGPSNYKLDLYSKGRKNKKKREIK